MGKTLRLPLFTGPYLSNQSLTSRKFETLRKKVSQAFQGHQDHRKPDIGSNINRMRENWRKEEKHTENLTHFSSQTASFICRVFLTHNELIRKFRTLRNIATPATTCNSRFAGNIPRLAEIFAGKTQNNKLNAPTFESHNFFVQTPIRAHFILLEIRLLDISNSTTHDPFWTPKGPQKLPRKPSQNTVQIHESKRIC